MEMLLGFRGELALVAPFLAFILFGDLLSLSEGLLETVAETPALLYGLILCCLVLLVTVYPPLLRFLWRMKPLDPSFSGRGELLAFIEAQRFRMRNILVWKTGGLQVNAAILGFLPRLRYILISDSMLRVFTIAELKAVLAHEIGHGKRRHTPLFVLMSLAFIALLALVETRFDPLGGLEDELLAAALLYLPALGAYTSLVFGFMSRRFEVEADVHASRALSDPALFIHTLDRLGSVTRRARSRKSWRHFSLERRIAILDSFFPETDGVRDPAGSPALARFERKMKRLKRAALILSLIALGLFAADLAAAGLFTA
jgi:Zn-dependent protease with chaperone function